MTAWQWGEKERGGGGGGRREGGGREIHYRWYWRGIINVLTVTRDNEDGGDFDADGCDKHLRELSRF